MAIIVFATLFSIGGAAPGETQAVRFCIVCSEHWLADAISNVLLFLPFGASLSASRRRRRSAESFQSIHMPSRIDCSVCRAA